MKISRILATSSLLIGVLAINSTAFASSGLCYYSFISPWGASSMDYPIDSPVFTVTNSSNVVTISGWQDTGISYAPANVDYAIWLNGWIDTMKYQTNVTGNPTKNGGNWYSRTFSNIPAGSKYYIAMTPHNSAGMDGAGNAYDGY